MAAWWTNSVGPQVGFAAQKEYRREGPKIDRAPIASFNVCTLFGQRNLPAHESYFEPLQGREGFSKRKATTGIALPSYEMCLSIVGHPSSPLQCLISSPDTVALRSYSFILYSVIFSKNDTLELASSKLKCRGVARIFQRGGEGHTVSNIIVMAFSPRNIVGCLLKKKAYKGEGGVTGTPGPPSLRP